MDQCQQDEDRLLTDLVRKLLNSPGNGQLLEDLFDWLNPSCQLFSRTAFRRFLEHYEQVFDIEDERVFPKTALIVCPTHSKVCGSCQINRCSGLHVCIFYLLSGKCQYGDNCLFGHDLYRNVHNARLLKDHHLDSLDIADLRELFRLPWVRKEVTIPKVCRYYNGRMGCTKQDQCHALHICLYYINEKCKFGEGCKRNHNIQDQQVMRVLSLYGVKVKGRSIKKTLKEVSMLQKKNSKSDDDSYDEPDEVISGVSRKLVWGSGAIICSAQNSPPTRRSRSPEREHESPEEPSLRNRNVTWEGVLDFQEGVTARRGKKRKSRKERRANDCPRKRQRRH